MADSGVIDISDTGEFLFDTAHHVTFLQFWMETETIEVDRLSEGFPARVMHAGWVALASGEEGVAGSTLTPDLLSVTYFQYFDFSSNLKVEPSGFDFDDRLIWKLGSGIVAHAKIFW